MQGHVIVIVNHDRVIIFPMNTFNTFRLDQHGPLSADGISSIFHVYFVSNVTEACWQRPY